MSRVGLFVLQHPTPDLVSIIWCNIIKFDTVIFLRRFHSSKKSNKGEYRFFLIHLQHKQLQLVGKLVGYHLHRRESQQSYIIMHLYFELPIPSRLAAVCLGLTFSIKERGELFWLPETSIEGPTDWPLERIWSEFAFWTSCVDRRRNWYPRCQKAASSIGMELSP